MAQTVAECLTAAEDSVTVINDINTNGKKSTYVGGSAEADTTWTQAEINAKVQQKADVRKKRNRRPCVWKLFKEPVTCCHKTFFAHAWLIVYEIFLVDF